MASESSSAVLDLNDADTEDTDATTVTDDTHEGAPLIMEHGYDIAIKVDAPMKQLSTLETFVTYRVRCVCARWATPPHVRRRYNHFKLLHKRLCAAHPLIAPPAPPPLHSARQQLDRYSPSFVAVRTLALNAFLDRIAKHPIMTHSEDLRIFLTTPDDELDKVFKSENNALNLWGLSSALYGSGESKTANGPRVKDPEFLSAADYLQSLQQKLTTLCALTTKLHKGTAALSTEMMGMKRACDAWATQAGGRCAGCAAGCAAGAAAGAGAAAAALRDSHRHKALLPLLAAYAAAHVDKIKQRDAIHATYVSGNTTGELHNRLEQASEALRSELSDWTPKTRQDVKSLLLGLADRQVTFHTQTLQGWENALKVATDTNIGDIFKTVSKAAVQNLSPSKCRSEMTSTETERDLDDFSEDFDVNSTTDDYFDDGKVNGGRNGEFVAIIEGVYVGNNDFPVDNIGSNPDWGKNDGLVSNYIGNVEVHASDDIIQPKGENLEDNVTGNIGNEEVHGDNHDLKTENSMEKLKVDNVNNFDVDNSNNTNQNQTVGNTQSINNVTNIDVTNTIVSQNVFLNEILDDTASSSGKQNVPKTEVITDPLRDFTDVDLS